MGGVGFKDPSVAVAVAIGVNDAGGEWDLGSLFLTAGLVVTYPVFSL